MFSEKRVSDIVSEVLTLSKFRVQKSRVRVQVSSCPKQESTDRNRLVQEQAVLPSSRTRPDQDQKNEDFSTYKIWKISVRTRPGPTKLRKSRTTPDRAVRGSLVRSCIRYCRYDSYRMNFIEAAHRE